MNLIPLTVAFILGVVVGVGACVFYFNYKVNRQLGMMEEHMQDIDSMMEMGMEDMIEDEDEEDE